MSDDLVKRLRLEAEHDLEWGSNPAEVLSRAADRIEELEAENVRLRGVLGRIAYASDYYSSELRAEDHGAGALAYAHKSTCNLARAALQQDKEGTNDQEPM